MPMIQRSPDSPLSNLSFAEIYCICGAAQGDDDAELNEEVAYFLGRDLDGDGRLNQVREEEPDLCRKGGVPDRCQKWAMDADKSMWRSQDEFHAMMSHVVETHGERADDDGGEANKLHPKDAEFAMKEFDADGDGAVTVEEYIAKVFHEEPQVSIQARPPCLMTVLDLSRVAPSPAPPTLNPRPPTPHHLPADASVPRQRRGCGRGG